jgi:hypothetical protein
MGMGMGMIITVRLHRRAVARDAAFHKIEGATRSVSRPDFIEQGMR